MKQALLIFLLLFAFLSAFSQDSRKEYLLNYSGVLDINDNDDYSTFAMLDTVLDKYNVFFTGEMHRTNGNMEVRWKMLKYLYQKAQVRVLVIEAPYSLGWLLNYYMSRNDSANYFYYSALDPTTKGRIFYKTLYCFNQSKPANERIIIRAIDTEDFLSIACKALTLLFNERPVPQAIQNDLEELTGNRKQDYADTLLRKIQPDTAFRSLYAEGYAHIIAILKGLSCKDCEPLAKGATSTTWLNRETLMYNNYLAALREFPGSKFYGQFGKAHICLSSGSRKWFKVNNWESIASRLNNNGESPVKGKVCSIGLDYFYITDEFNKEDDKLLFDFMLENKKRKFVLLKLDQPNSPFEYVGRNYQYTLNINYGYKDELNYNIKNDHYDLMENEAYTVIAIYAGYQRWKHQAIELGIANIGREMKSINYPAGMGFFFEFNPNQRLHTYRISAWGGGRFVQAGLSPVFSTSYRSSAFFIRPEMGVRVREYSLTYGYNAKLYNRSLTGFNTHMITLRALLSMNKY